MLTAPSVTGYEHTIPGIAVVDDEIPILEMVEERGRSLPCEVHVTPDPDESLRLVAEGKVDVLISDLKMPVIDGVQLLQRAHEIKPLLILILFSAYEPTPEQMAIIRSLGIRLYSKTEDQELLFDDLAELGAQQTETESPALQIQLQYASERITFLEKRNSELERHHRKWAREFVKLVEEIKNPDEVEIVSSQGSFSVSQLLKDLEDLNYRGLEYLSHWTRAKSLVSRIRAGKSK